jgi:large subunit ribosomal protein L9
MKVILSQTVPKLGKEGQVVTVANGYARNFLFPRGLAIVADRNQLAALEKRKARLAAKVADSAAAAKAQGEKLEGQTVKIEGKVGRDAGKLFGAITAQDIADAIKAQLGEDIERKRIGLVNPIKRLGSFDVVLDLHPDVDANISVIVFDPNAPVEVAAPAEESTEETEADETVEA